MDDLKFYYDRDIVLFPLQENSKRPAKGFKWRQAGQNEKRCRNAFSKGKNLAAIVPHDHIVLDVDVRNGGVESLARLNADLNLAKPLEFSSPTVVTPTGGLHIWIKIDKDFKSRGKLDSVRYPGIDVKKRGGYVVAAGSKISGKSYQWTKSSMDDDGGLKMDVMQMPPKLEPIVKRKVVDEHSASESGEFDSADLIKMLEHLDVTDFANRDDWISLMMSCHHATGGCSLSREVFVDWSSTDPHYNDYELRNSHRHQWDALEVDRGVTSATLMHFLKDKAVDLFSLKMELFGTTMSSREDFTDFVEEVGEDKVENLPFSTLSATDLFKLDIKTTYLIDDVLDKDQVMLVSGPKKALKTTILLDMALSLAAGTPFLDRFNVPERKKTLVLTAEAGAATYKSKLQAIFDSKLGHKMPEDALDYLFVGSEVPRIASDSVTDLPDVEALIKLCKYKEIEVVVIDPAYLALNPKDSSNLFSMGLMLRGFIDTLKELDVTVIIAHHSTKGSGNISLDYPDLSTMSGSGFAEFAGQWLLIGRKSEYEYNGQHELLMNIGGRAGHGGNYDISINEGQFDRESEDWRRWEINWTNNFQDLEDGSEYND
jgi:hypothetical protein